MKTVIQSIGFALTITLLWSLSYCVPEDPSKYTPSNYVIQGDMDTGPAFSPDGNSIAYLHDDTNKSATSYPTGLYIIDRNGNNRKLVLPGVHLDPAWSPNGQWLVFSSLGAIQKCKINGDSLTTFIGLNNLKYPQFYYPDWSADGKHLLFNNPTEGGGLFHANSNFTNASRLFASDKWIRGNPESSPDGSQIIFLRGAPEDSNWEVYKSDTLTLVEIRLTQNNRDDRAPTWSPDGLRIAWSSSIRLSIMNSDGSGLKEIGYGNDPSWSFNNEIIFSHANGDYSKEVLYTILPDGTNRKQITF
jgi:Tol biopolymer transport system component